MQTRHNNTVLVIILAICVANTVLGQLLGNALLSAAGLVGMCYVLLRVVYNRSEGMFRCTKRPNKSKPTPAKTALPGRPDPNDTESLIEQMLNQGRFALLLRPQVVGNLTSEQFQAAMDALGSAMSLVPDGEVVLGRLDDALDDGELNEDEIAAVKGRTYTVECFFLDRNPVTNRQYYEFVAASGYSQMALWDESILPAVLDLVDCTGIPGPRYWENGCFEPGEEDFPVIGVCWYEANAYARWVGKRLPGDAEWVKAGSWPVPLSADSRVQRKFPWGNTMDRGRTNLWGSGPEKIVAIDQFPLGVSVGGVYQLIGNVWEWTCGDFASGAFHSGNHSVSELVLSMPLKSIRGGAFDTYFDNQATCQFQSGENPLHRKHNIGFRCAVAVTDLTMRKPQDSLPTAAEVSAAVVVDGDMPVAVSTSNVG